METKFSFSVEFWRPSQAPRSGYMTGGTHAQTMGQAIAEALPDAQYYVDLEPHTRVELIVTEDCPVCRNDGTITTRKIWHGRLIVKTHKCENCHGKPPTAKEVIHLPT